MFPVVTEHATFILNARQRKSHRNEGKLDFWHYSLNYPLNLAEILNRAIRATKI